MEPRPSLDPLAYNVQLPAVEFEGPLNLLLHLIQSHQLNILDIPMHFITEKYLEYLSVMQKLSIDLASEYLVMAAVLVHIKSKMLLPHVPAEQQGDDLLGEELDPREELVRRLLEYQKYKHAAAALAASGASAQETFPRPEPPPAPQGSGPLAQLPVFNLLDAFQKLLDRRKIKVSHEISFDRLSITDRINELTELLRKRRRVAFEDLFEGQLTRFDLVLTFLALLEMSKLRMTRLFQADTYSSIHIEYALSDDEEPLRLDDGPSPLPPTG